MIPRTTCDKIIESYDDEKNFNEKESNMKSAKLLYFTCSFVNYYSIIDSC